MTLDHVGIAASPEAEALFRRLLAAAPYKAETVGREGVTTTFFGDGGAPGAAPKLELLEATRPDSPVATFIEKRGPGLHHLAFEVADLEAEMARVRAEGFRLLADAPRPGADGKRIVFLHPKDTGGVLIELVESVRRPPVWERVPHRGGRLAVQTSGPDAAPPLVVLHGALGSTSLETDRLIRLWEKRFRVYALDFMGHGRSDDCTDAVPLWADYTANVTAVLDHFGLDSVRLFGFSMGGGVALAAALEHPGRVARLAVHGVNVQWDADEVDAMTGPMEGARLAEEHAFWARRLEETHGAERWRRLVGRLVAFTRGLPGHHLTDEALAGVACPTLVSAGDRDRFFDVRHAVGLYRALPDARLWVVPGLDHPIQGVDVPAFAGAVGDFLLGA
jgi:methylmalonyl-CoA epimerase